MYTIKIHIYIHTLQLHAFNGLLIILPFTPFCAAMYKRKEQKS